MGQHADDMVNYHMGFGRVRRDGANYLPDPLRYFTRVKIDGIIRETEKAYQFKNGKYSFWVPKALCRELRVGSVLIWDDFKYTFIEIITTDDINDMFDVIEDEEPDFTEVLTHLNFPTPFD